MTDSLKGTLETILVVDDNEAVLRTVVAILERANLRVLSADCGANAVDLATKTEGKIHLLLSDVDMPEVSGPDLGQALKKTRPAMHVMLMSQTEIYWFSIMAGLWGLYKAGPFGHAGKFTIMRDEINFGHNGEATTSRLAFQALTCG